MTNPYDDIPPEECPMCKGPNWNEETEAYVHSSECFCSDECERDYDDFQRVGDDTYYRALMEEHQFAKQLTV
jgi:hypothetical protein